MLYVSFLSSFFFLNLQVPRCVFKTSCVAPEVRTLCKIHRTCVYRCKKKKKKGHILNACIAGGLFLEE